MNNSDVSQKTATIKGRDKAALILEVSKDILVEEGFSALSFRNIALRINASIGNIQYYYPSKDDLMVKLANYIFDRWNERFEANVPPECRGGKEVLIFSVNFMIKENKRGKTACLLMEMWAVANHNLGVAKMLDAFYGRMRSWIAHMIMSATPDLDDSTCALRAALITAQIEGLMILTGPNRARSPELANLEVAALDQIARLAFSAP